MSLLASYSKEGLELGGLFNYFISDAKSIEKKIDVFKKQHLNRYIKRENNTFKIDFNKLCKEIDATDARFQGYLQTLVKADGTIDQAAASTEGFSQYLKETGQSFDFAALKANLLNAALNAGILLAVSLAIKGIAAAWDQVNVTVEEQTEKINGIREAYEGLQSEYDQLSAKEDLTQAEKDRLNYLQQKLDLEKEILEIEQRQLYREKLGNSWTDEFDKESWKSQLEKETGLGSGSILTMSHRIRDVFEKLEKDDESIAAAKGGEHPLSAQAAADLAKKKEKHETELRAYRDEAVKKEAAYLQNYQEAKEMIDSGLLSGEDLELAQRRMDEWKKLLNISVDLQADIDKKLGQYSFKNYLGSMPELSFHKDTLQELLADNDDVSMMQILSVRFQDLWADMNRFGITVQDLRGLFPQVTEGADAFGQSVRDLTVSDTVTQIRDQLSPALTELQSAYQNIFTEQGFTLENVDNDMLSGLMDAFAKINEETEGAFDTGELDRFFAVLTSGNADAETVQAAVERLANTYLYSTDVMDSLNTATAGAVASQLEELGVSNAQEIVQEELLAQQEELAARKLYMAEKGGDLTALSEQEQLAFLKEKICAGELGGELAVLQLKKMQVNGTLLDESTDIQQILALAKAAGITSLALGEFARAKASYDEAVLAEDKGGMDYWSGRMKMLEGQVNQDIAGFHTGEWEFGSAAGSAADAASRAGESAADAYREAFEKELEELKGLQDTGAVTEKEYLDRLRSLNDRYFRDKKEYLEEYRRYEKEYYDGMLGVYDRAASTAVKAVDRQVKALDRQKDALNDQIGQLEKQKEAVEKFYEDQIDAIEEAKDATEKQYQDQIDALEEEKEAMEKANKARENALNLQKAQYDLERMQNQKTRLVYKNGQMVWETDAAGIREKREAVGKARYDITVANIENQVDSLNRSMEEALEKFDEQIRELEEAKERETASIDARIQGLETQIELIDRQRDSLEDYKELWSDVADRYQEQQDALLAAQVLGADWEAQILAGRLGILEEFKNRYAGLYTAMAGIYTDNTGVSVGKPSGAGAGSTTGSQGASSAGAEGQAGGGGAGGSIFALPEMQSEEWGASLDAILKKLQDFKICFQEEWDAIVEIAANSVGVSEGSGRQEKKEKKEQKEEKSKTAAGGMIGVLQEGALSMEAVFQDQWLPVFSDLLEGEPSLTVYCSSIIEEIRKMCEDIDARLSASSAKIYSFITALEALGLTGGGEKKKAQNKDLLLPFLAKGARKLRKGGLAVTNEAGAEMIISPSSGAILTPLRPGDSVLKEALTDNLFAWGAVSPAEFLYRAGGLSTQHSLRQDLLEGKAAGLSYADLTGRVENQSYYSHIGTIRLEGVQDPDTLARRITRELPGKLYQERRKS